MTIKCKKCGKDSSDNRSTCPACNSNQSLSSDAATSNPQAPDKPKKAIGCFLLTIIICLLLIFLPGRGSLEKNNNKLSEPLTGTAKEQQSIVDITEVEQKPAIQAKSIEAASPVNTQGDDEFDEEKARQARAAIQKRAEEAKPELIALYKEFDNMIKTSTFREYGFSSKNKAANDWKKRVEECRTRLEADKSLPVQLRIVPAALLDLGTNYVWSKGRINEDIQWNIEQIEAGLNWKAEE